MIKSRPVIIKTSTCYHENISRYLAEIAFHKEILHFEI